jgi:hypothetical protein
MRTSVLPTNFKNFLATLENISVVILDNFVDLGSSSVHLFFTNLLRPRFVKVWQHLVVDFCRVAPISGYMHRYFQLNIVSFQSHCKLSL